VIGCLPYVCVSVGRRGYVLRGRVCVSKTDRTVLEWFGPTGSGMVFLFISEFQLFFSEKYP